MLLWRSLKPSTVLSFVTALNRKAAPVQAAPATVVTPKPVSTK